MNNECSGVVGFDDEGKVQDDDDGGFGERNNVRFATAAGLRSLIAAVVELEVVGRTKEQNL